MHEPRRSMTLTAVLGTVLLAAACAHRIGSQVPVTPYEQAMSTNAVIAAVNNSVGAGLVALNELGVAPFKDVERTRSLLDYTYRIAAADKQLTTILALGADKAQPRGAEIKQYTDAIAAAAQELVNTGVLGVKNPRTQRNVDTEVQTIAILVGDLYSTLVAAGIAH